jgi:hypothetical protein
MPLFRHACRFATLLILLAGWSGADAEPAHWQVRVDKEGTADLQVAVPNLGGPVMLHIASPYVTQYTITNRDGGLLHLGGNQYPARQRRVLHPAFILPLTAPVGDVINIALRASPGLSIPVRTVTESTERTETTLRLMGDGVYYGAMLLMVLFAFLSGSFGGDEHAFRLATTLAIWAITMATAQGYGGLLLWPWVAIRGQDPSLCIHRHLPGIPGNA